MKHYHRDEWMAYMAGQRMPGLREEMDAHLEACDRCLAVYMECLDAAPSPFSESVMSEDFLDSVMSAVRAEAHLVEFIEGKELPRASGSQRHEEKRKKHAARERWFQKPLFHYSAAAVITLVLMSAGVFQDLAHGVDRWEQAAPTQDGNLTHMLMDRTLSLLDTINPKESGGTSLVP